MRQHRCDHSKKTLHENMIEVLMDLSPFDIREMSLQSTLQPLYVGVEGHYSNGREQLTGCNVDRHPLQTKAGSWVDNGLLSVSVKSFPPTTPHSQSTRIRNIDVDTTSHLLYCDMRGILRLDTKLLNNEENPNV